VNDGLKAKYREAIIGMLRANPRVKRAVLFGSRARGTYSPASDVDIALYGEELGLDDLSSLSAQIDALPVPQKVDLLLFHQIDNPELREQIEKYGVGWFYSEDKEPKSAIPEGWKMTTLGEVAEVNPTESLGKNNVAKYVAMENLTPFTRKIYKFEKKEFNGGTKFRNGDTLLARITPCLENGKTAFVDILEENEIGFGSTEYIVIREKDGKSDRKFLYYLAISPRFRDIAIKAMTGSSGRQRVQTDLLVNELFPIPPLHEQRAIAGVLGSLDDKIELLRSQNQTLEQIAQAIFKEWFVNFNFPGAEGKMIESELGEIPQGWRVGRLGDEFKIIMGQSPLGESYNEIGEGTIFFQGRTDFTERFPRTRLYTTEPKRIAEKFDVLVSVRAPVGDINMAYSRCCIGRGLAAIRGQFKSYALYKIKSLQKKLSKFESEGTIFGSINKDDFANIKVTIPSQIATESFDTLICSYDRKIFNNYSQIQILSTLRYALLPKLMKGEVRVKSFNE